jgi:hypothetical protein
VDIGTATATSKSHKWICKGAVSREHGKPPFLEISFMGFYPSYGKVKLDVREPVDFDRLSQVDSTDGGDRLARVNVIVQEQGSGRQARLTALPPRHSRKLTG